MQEAALRLRKVLNKAAFSAPVGNRGISGKEGVYNQQTEHYCTELNQYALCIKILTVHSLMDLTVFISRKLQIQTNSSQIKYQQVQYR